MRKIFLVVLILICTFVFNGNCFACTAFSVKSQKVYYGKNWDFNPDRNDTVFYMLDVDEDITRLDIRLSSNYLCTSVNNKGLFVTTNYNTNIKSAKDYKGLKNKIILRDFHEESVGQVSSINEINQIVDGKNILSIGYPEHIFSSDLEGNACILETDNENSYIINDEDGFLVMTNFPNHTVKIQDNLDSITCYRYKIAYQYIKDNIDSFDMEDGIEVLKRTAQAGAFPAKYSLLGDPEENVIYLFLNRDYDKIWKISFKSRTISTFKGFEENTVFNFGINGIKYIDLMEYQKTGKREEEASEEDTREEKGRQDNQNNKEDDKKDLQFNLRYFIILSGIILAGVLIIFTAKSKIIVTTLSNRA